MYILNPVDITGILLYTMKEQSGKPRLFPDVQMKMVKTMSRQLELPVLSLSPIRFTPRSEEYFYGVVDNPDFSEIDSQLIYQALREYLEPIPFSDYLKRYIYQTAKISQPFESVPLTEYQDIMLESFACQDVPASFRHPAVRIRSATRNWLTQQTVSRDAVLLIGFGLKMSRRDVDDLLMKGLHETRLNMRDAREYICGYCYEYGFGFHKYERLMEASEEMAEAENGPKMDTGSTDCLLQIRLPEKNCGDEELIRNAAMLLKAHRNGGTEEPATRTFNRLFRQAQETTAQILNMTEQDGAVCRSRMIEKKLADSDHLFDYQKQHRIQDEKARLHLWKPEEIAPADIERVLQAAVPRDQYDNLLTIKRSTLRAQFCGRQMTRQRLEKLLAENVPVTRYDIIMLQFYICSQKKKDAQSRYEYYREFVEQTNECLSQSDMGPLYAANPFECFVMMCILSDEPLSTYSDVIEQSYAEEKHEDHS